MTEKKNYWGYLPILCSIENYKDNGSKVIIEFPVNIKDNRSIEVALIGDTNEIHLIRVSMKSLDKEDVFQKKNLKQYQRHLITCLQYYQ